MTTLVSLYIPRQIPKGREPERPARTESLSQRRTLKIEVLYEAKQGSVGGPGGLKGPRGAFQPKPSLQRKRKNKRKTEREKERKSSGFIMVYLLSSAQVCPSQVFHAFRHFSSCHDIAGCEVSVVACA